MMDWFLLLWLESHCINVSTQGRYVGLMCDVQPAPSHLPTTEGEQ
jgi:hypothetical protein